MGNWRRRKPKTERDEPKDIVRLRLDGPGYLGDCVGRDGDLVIFAAYGLPGEEVVVEIDDRRRTWAKGRVIEVLSPAPERAQAPCPVFGICGGCAWQHTTYEYELALKERVVRDHLTRIGKMAEVPVLPILAAGTPWRYRNQARFSVTRDGRLGFTRRTSRDIIEVPDCYIMQDPINDMLNRLQGRVKQVHQIVVRYGARTGTSLVYPALPGIEDVPSGQTHYTERLFGRDYDVAAFAFFQVNTLPALDALPVGADIARELGATGPFSQSEALAALALEGLQLDGAGTLLDAYSGVGTFALLAAERAGFVIGIEEASVAVENAQLNARGRANVDFRVGRVENVLPELETLVDFAILDPARVGCAPATLKALLEARPGRIVYVSCDPATLARDLAVLGAAYDVEWVRPVDMFPRTRHVECVAALRLAR